METEKQILFKKLGKIITGFFEHPELLNADSGQLQDIFWDNFSEVAKIALALNISVSKFNEFSANYSEDKDGLKIAEFLADTMENDDSYVLLNYFMYKFIQSCLVISKKEQEAAVQNLLSEAGVTEVELGKIVSGYDSLVAAKAVSVSA